MRKEGQSGPCQCRWRLGLSGEIQDQIKFLDASLYCRYFVYSHSLAVFIRLSRMVLGSGEVGRESIDDNIGSAVTVSQSD